MTPSALATTHPAIPSPSPTKKALVYHAPGEYAWENKPLPTIQFPSDAIISITTTTICGTDLHILKGDLPPVTDARIPGPKELVASSKWEPPSRSFALETRSSSRALLLASNATSAE